MRWDGPAPNSDEKIEFGAITFRKNRKFTLVQICKNILKYYCIIQYGTQIIIVVPEAFSVMVMNGRNAEAAAVIFTDLKTTETL